MLSFAGQPLVTFQGCPGQPRLGFRCGQCRLGCLGLRRLTWVKHLAGESQPGPKLGFGRLSLRQGRLGLCQPLPCFAAIESRQRLPFTY